jgi:hypothetical protein
MFVSAPFEVNLVAIRGGHLQVVVKGITASARNHTAAFAAFRDAVEQAVDRYM